MAERHESLHSVRPLPVRPAREIGQGRTEAGSLARLACPMPPPSSLPSSLFLPLVAIVILIRHSNNDSLAANWPKERSGRGRAVNRPLWMEWLCAAAFSSFPPLCRHRMDEPRRRNQSWSATRARTHLSVRFERPSKQLREGRFHFPTTGKSTQTTKSEVAPDLGKSLSIQG